MHKRRSLRLRAFIVALIAIGASLVAMLSGCNLPPIYEYWDSIVLYTLEISPSYIALQEGQKATFSVIGGKVPYSFELSGDGTITPLPGSKVRYSAPAGAGAKEAWVGVRDIYDATSLARVMVETIISQLAIVPGNVALEHGQTVDFTFDGGMQPFTFHLVEGLGTVNESTGLYTAPSMDTNAVVRLEDGSGQLSDARISVRAGSQALAIIPAMVVLEFSATPFKFYAQGGTGSYTFSVIGVGSITETGDYTPSGIGIDTVSVADGVSTPAEASVTVVATAAIPLVIIPRSIDINMGTSFQFSAEGGLPPYSYAMVSGYGGTIDASGIYTAPSTRQGAEKVRVVDSRGISDTATVKVKKK